MKMLRSEKLNCKKRIMSYKGGDTIAQIQQKVIEILDQINHYIDLRGFETSIWDDASKEWIDNPHNATIDRLTNELKNWYNKGNAIGINWNKLPQHYHIWLQGYLED